MNFLSVTSVSFIFVSRSVTLVGEADRKILKAAIKHSSGGDRIRHRIIPAEFVQTWFERIDSLNNEIAAILAEEKEEKQVNLTIQFLALGLMKTIDKKGGNGIEERRKYGQA